MQSQSTISEEAFEFMRVRILGCSGGIGAGLRTTSILIDKDILIDCGTGVGDLSLSEMSEIRHLFFTHTHLDHFAAFPLLVDTLFDHLQQHPLVIHCQPKVMDVFRRNVFNWEVWPDFFELPNKDRPVLIYEPLLPGDSCQVGGRSLEMIEVNHQVPTVAYRVEDATAAFAFSGDTTTNDNLWETLNQYDKLDFLIVECAFGEKDLELSNAAKHYCPSLLAADLSKLRHRPKTGISHLKPGEEETIFQEIEQAIPTFELLRLSGGDEFEL